MNSKIMKKCFYILLSILAVTSTSIFCFSILKKNSQNKERKKRLNRYYFEKMSTPFYTLNDPKVTDYRITFACEWIKETEEHMSKDGYDWHQIDQIKVRAETEQQTRRWKTNAGYDDGINGKDSDEYYQKDPYYQHGFRRGREKLKK